LGAWLSLSLHHGWVYSRSIGHRDCDDIGTRYSLAKVRLVSTGESKMNSAKTLAMVLIVAGVLGLAYGSFTYTKETHNAKIGPIELSVKDKETINFPVWVSVGAIAAGMILLFARK
jgi:hypothetical protein